MKTYAKCITLLSYAMYTLKWPPTTHIIAVLAFHKAFITCVHCAEASLALSCVGKSCALTYVVMDVKQQNGDAGAAPANAEAASTVTLDDYLTMGDEAKAQLPLSRRKKLEKLATARKRKEMKAAAAAATSKPVAKKDPASSNRSSDKKKKKADAQAAADAANNYVNITPKGEKKILDKEMAPVYQPRAVESAWYEWWEASGYFRTEVESAKGLPEKERFVMVLPPPNVTGSLHLGHALMCAVEDAITRYNRMHGKPTLWVPGVDHAGIATQVVVEKQIKRTRGIDRHVLGRDAFVEEVWKWKQEYGGKIVKQLRRIGSSMDWQREQFTMSDELNSAVKEAFVRFYDDGLIYRDKRLVNWSSSLRTAISDIEVENIDIEAYAKRKVPGHPEEVEFGVLTKFAYRVDDSDEELVVATTRLETMLGDTAVAVHPDDKRYKHLIGKQLQHPLVDRKLPIIADSELVDMSFGTGAVKVTPAHDPNDFACGRRNGLPEITIFTDDGDVNEEGGPRFAGLKRYVARVEVEKALAAQGLLRGKEPNPMSLPVCSRSGDVVEPLLKPQWWVNCKDLAKRSADAVRNGELKIVPDSFEDVWYRWLDNIRDWCVSRQLWWGHRIPAYKVTTPRAMYTEAGLPTPTEEVWVVGRCEEEARSRAAKQLSMDESKISLEQDEDVLDTWFSSGLFPFSVFGWPNRTEDLGAFFPTTILETGHDILFFWVARMVMMSIGLTGKLPFKTVLLHSLVRDKRGRKMSKSLGNVIDPLEVINGATLEALAAKLNNSNLNEKEIKRATADQREDYPGGIPECGADSLRIGLLAYMTQGGDINLDVGRVIGYRNFGNKLWNATRFAMSNLGTDFAFSKRGLEEAIAGGAPLDLWVLSRLNKTCEAINEAFETYRMGDAVSIAYKFWMSELCGVYLEGLKPIMRGADEKAKTASKMVLYECLSSGLRMLHPMMPFVTEELFQRLPGPNTSESIMIARFPTYDPARDFPAAERYLDAITRCVHAVRFLKADYGLKPSAAPEVYIKAANLDAASMIIPAYVQTLAPCGPVRVIVNGSLETPAAAAAKVVDEMYEAHIVLAGIVHMEAEAAKLEAAASQKRLLVEEHKKKMNVEGYEARVPSHIQARNAAALEKYMAELENLSNLAERFRKLLKVQTS